MGLTRGSVGRGALDGGLSVRRQPGERVVALAGMPNVGKSTVFNALTGLHQHTGNWTGKTVANACGRCRTAQGGYMLVDIPGTYSLSPHSAEEEVARDLLCFGEADAAVVVCDATCLERGLPLALQIMETGLPVIVCVNLMDEARRLGDYIVEHYHRQTREHTCFAEHYMLGIPCSAEIRPYGVKTLGHTTVCPAGLSLSGRISAPAKLRSTCRR